MPPGKEETCFLKLTKTDHRAIASAYHFLADCCQTGSMDRNQPVAPMSNDPKTVGEVINDLGKILNKIDF